MVLFDIFSKMVDQASNPSGYELRRWAEMDHVRDLREQREDAETAFTRQGALSNLQARNSLNNQLEFARKATTAKMQGAKDAGINLGLAASEGVASGGGGAGIATPVEPKNTPTRASGLGPVGHSVGGINEFMDAYKTEQEVENLKAEENLTNAKAEEIRSQTPQSQANLDLTLKKIDQVQETIDKTRQEIQNLKTSNRATELMNDWQIMQNDLLKSTKDDLIKEAQWRWKVMAKNADLLKNQARNENIKFNHSEEYWTALINNFWANSNLAITKAITENKKQDLLQEQAKDVKLDADYKDYTFTARQEILGWQGYNESKFQENFEKQLKIDIDWQALERRGQNMQLIGDVVRGVADVGTSMMWQNHFMKLGTMERVKQTAVPYNGKWMPNKQVITRPIYK